MTARTTDTFAGYGEHIGRYEHVAQELAAHGAGGLTRS
jgi:alpha-beta hydrolase superfamily lysophospholipase